MPTTAPSSRVTRPGIAERDAPAQPGVRKGTTPESTWHGGFQPQVEAGVSPFADLRPTPARASSLGTTLETKLNTFAAGTGNGQWPNLPRAQVAARLAELVHDPTLLNQAGLNTCGPAAVMYILAKRHVERFVDLVIDLYERGRASFGSVQASGDGLFHKNPAAMTWPHGNRPQALDWMLFSAVQRSIGDVFKFGGEPSDKISAMSLPGEVETWLKDGIGYSSVNNEANKFYLKSLDHLKALSPDANRDILVLVHVGKKGEKDHLQAQAPGEQSSAAIGAGPVSVDNLQAQEPWEKSSTAIGEAVLDLFPNHWLVLEAPVADDGTTIVATAWTWGRSGYLFSAQRDVWAKSYYGAITGQK
jgi:hypothetical protein